MKPTTSTNSFPPGAPRNLFELGQLREEQIGILVGMANARPEEFARSSRIGDRLRQKRLEKNWSTSALAQESGVQSKLVSWLEAGLFPTSLLSDEIIEALAEATQLTTAELWDPAPVSAPARETLGARVVGMLSAVKEGIQSTWELTLLGSYGVSLGYQATHDIGAPAQATIPTGSGAVVDGQLHIELGPEVAGRVITVSDPAVAGATIAEDVLNDEGQATLNLPENVELKSLAVIVW